MPTSRRARYDRAVKLYEEGVYDAALVELRRAYELRPSYKLLYNMALSRVGMRDYAGALEDYQRYLRDGGERIADDRRGAVEGEIARLEQRVGRLSIRTDVEGAEVLIDDQIVGSAPLSAPITVNSGVRRVLVRHREHPPQSLRVSIAGGEQQELNLPLSPGGKPTVQPVAPAPRAPQPAVAPLPRLVESAPAASRASGWSEHRRAVRGVAWGTTAAVGALALTLGVVALVNDGEIADARPRPVDDPAKLEDKAQRTERLALASDVLTGATVALAGVSLWLTLRTRERRPTTTVGFRPAGLSLRTRF